ncbi:hypothetical protein [Kribbella sp. NPDC023855]|uniref:hypothetical protein n=1 Tax=Kribbella sp. NPDC023855 TaxID=3154698 RepID=UPI0033FF73D5
MCNFLHAAVHVVVLATQARALAAWLFAAYAAQDMDGIRSVLTEDVEWVIPGHQSSAVR